MKSAATTLIFALACLISCIVAAEPALPSRVDLRPELSRFNLVPKNQGGREVCSLFAITGLAEFEWSRCAPPQPMSEEFLIWAASATSGKNHEQAMFYEAIHGLCAAGICAEPMMPFQSAPDSNRHPSACALSDANARTNWNVLWLKGWDLKTGLSQDQLTELKHQLASGHPVAMGARWPLHEKLTAAATMETPLQSEVFDGHSIICVGYEDDVSQPGGGRLLFRNHRGQAWADHGYAWLTYRYASLYINDAVALRTCVSSSKSLRLEAESLKILSSTACHPTAQDMSPWGAKLWSNGAQLFCRAQNNACLDAEFTVPETNQFRLDLNATFAPDYGKLQISIDGKPLTSALDFYSARVHPSGPINLGTVLLIPGPHRINFTVTDKNALSTGYNFGLDALTIVSTSATHN